MLGSMLAAAVGAAACSSSGGAAHPTASAARQLRRAARRTLAASSYKLRMGEVDVKHPKFVTTKFQAPDRTETGSGSNVMIAIGNTSYLRFPDGSHAFTRNTIPGNIANAGGQPNYAVSTVASVLYPAQHARTGVSTRGNTYVVTTSKHGAFGPARFTYQVSGGRITDLRIDQRLHGKSFNRAYHYFDFDVPNVIKAPPVNQVKDAAPTPECPPGGLASSNPGTGIQFCVTSSGSGASSSAHG
jgi:hypothetical protein